ncbi:MAG: winged helix-turn-helix domain-containing protein, partial [Thermoanaerobaculia bacterium]
MTASAFPVYQFGEFRLDPAARELRRGDRLLKLPPLTFDCLVLLIENRDRAVSREELIAAVWDKPYVEEAQVNQRIMQVRRALGDSSQEPLFIRTVSGFGYRWIAETEGLPAAAPGSPAATTAFPGLGFRRWRLLVPAALVVVLAAVALTHAYIQRNHTKPLPREPGEAVVVLPLDVRAREGTDAGWIRLGAMDLIAGRLRDSGLPVPSSDSVVAALHAVEARPEHRRLTALRDTLGAGLLVQGSASQASDGWKVELTATAADGDRRRVESDATEVVGSARRAADLLLAALGEPVASAENGNQALDELLQRAKAAILALELETARTILTRAPESLQDEPELRLQLAWVEYRAGRGDEAEAITTKLLDAPSVAARPRVHAEILMLRGLAEGREQEDWVGGEPYFDAAVEALDGQPWAPELATALTMRGAVRISRHDFDAGAQDLGRARTLFEVGGDRLGLARIYNFFGNLELVRKRPADALPRFQASIEICESFGH